VRNTIFIVTGLCLLLVQENLFRVLGRVHVPGLSPSLVLPLILYMGVHEYSIVKCAGVAFLLGYVSDLVGIAPVGLYTFTYVGLFLLARAAGVRLAAQTAMMQLGLTFAFALVHSVMILVLLAIFGKDAYVPRALYPMVLPHALATAAVAPLVFRLAQALDSAAAMPRAREME
jgi:rod shape-determining protein MreD